MSAADNMGSHDCFDGRSVYYKNFRTVLLLETTHWEFKTYSCIHCGRRYLRAFMETQGYSRSGHWMMAEIDPSFHQEKPSELTLLEFLYEQDRLFYGGSHWQSTGQWTDKNERHPLYMRLKSYVATLSYQKGRIKNS